MRGWAPRGETPVLQYHFNWHQLSAMAGITFYRFYFRLFPGAIKGAQVVEFLHALAPTQSEPPFLVAQLVVLAVFIALGFVSVRKFHPLAAV